MNMPNTTGANAYMVKPFQEEAIFKTLETILFKVISI